MSTSGFNYKEQKKEVAKELLELMEKVPDNDHPQSVSQFIAYLNGLLRIKMFTPPMIEIMTLIKTEKPKLYHATRLKITATSHLRILFQLETTPELARERIQEFFEK